ncbi:PREDICTED: 21 kDa protein-like [Nicotiana attenuata]|uniref:21 kDa protein n=1 Tax=Nicotiana attenuata TaxID=49451 RepID=A0A1J6JS83_NICAT|nr:PREDICTED: 21 kDa protein-like [Nicotiana attenuata]OIT20597.1 21 kda protein [Nicotiana attenuata]
MAAAKLVFLAAALSLFYLSGAADTATSFIKNSCKPTTYPDLCFASLSGYAQTIKNSQEQLIKTALSVSLDRAQSTKGFVRKLLKFKGLKPREYAAIKDCIEETSDSVDRLSKSVSELKEVDHSRGKDFLWHISNVETWVSAAITDENTCTDGFAGRALNGRIKASIRNRIGNLAQVTSNALALINQYAAKH